MEDDSKEKEAFSKVSELKVMSTRFRSKEDRTMKKKKSKKELAREDQERRRTELEEVKQRNNGFFNKFLIIR